MQGSKAYTPSSAGAPRFIFSQMRMGCLPCGIKRDADCSCLLRRRLGSGLDEVSRSWSGRFEDVLSDDFAYNYLLRFAIKEHSSENVLLLRQADQFFESGGREASDELKQSLMMVGLPGKMRSRLSVWARSSDGDGDAFPTGTPPADVVSEAFRLCYGVVRQDVFPRFVQSDHHREMGVLHLSNMLRFADFRAAFLPTLQPLEAELAEFWIAANTWRERHMSLASGWASEQTIDEAKGIWRRHTKTWALDAAAARMVDARLFEAPADLFCEMQMLALNQLRMSYECFLAAPSGAGLLKAIGFKRIPMVAPPPPSPRYCTMEEDYAVGW